MQYLYKSKINKVFFGVCGGIAEKLNLDPVLVRILFILGTIMSGSLLLWMYLLLALIIPKSND